MSRAFVLVGSMINVSGAGTLSRGTLELRFSIPEYLFHFVRNMLLIG